MKLKSLFAAMMLAAVSMASHAVTVELDTVGTPQVGQSFDVQLKLDSPFAGLSSDEELLAFGFHLGFDSSLLKFDSFTPASGWEDDSAHLATGIFSSSSLGVDNVGQGSILLATLHFDVLQAGTTAISLVTDAGDFNQGIWYLNADPVDLNASEMLTLAQPVPEPSTLLLMAGGLGGLVAWRRRSGAAPQAQA